MAKSTKRKSSSFFNLFLKSYRVSSIDKSSLKETPIVGFYGYQLISYGIYLIFLLLVLCFLLIVYTPVKNLIPQNVNIKKGELIDVMVKVDSLEDDLRKKTLYINVIHKILQGEVIDSFVTITRDSTLVFDNIDLSPSRADSTFRELVKNEDLYNIPTSHEMSYAGMEDFVFFRPADGVVISQFDVAESHFGVDIVSNSDASVKATLDGVVVFSDWSIQSGHTVLVQHAENIISVYMHNSSVNKKINDLVKAGEVIGVVGNSGEGSLGPHLHFELWQNGSPINPLDYIDF